jgi:hypothetical protein
MVTGTDVSDIECVVQHLAPDNLIILAHYTGHAACDLNIKGEATLAVHKSGGEKATRSNDKDLEEYISAKE